MKQCSNCQQWKSETEFHKNRTRKDGLQHECKECKKIRQDNYDRTEILARYNSSKKGRSARKKYEKTKRGQDAIKKYRMSKKYRDTSREYAQKYKKENPKKHKAHLYINNEIDMGRMQPAKEFKCNNCNSQASHYHHPNYDKPNYVIPLCAQCHANEHKD